MCGSIVGIWRKYYPARSSGARDFPLAATCEAHTINDAPTNLNSRTMLSMAGSCASAAAVSMQQ